MTFYIHSLTAFQCRWASDEVFCDRIALRRSRSSKPTRLWRQRETIPQGCGHRCPVATDHSLRLEWMGYSESNHLITHEPTQHSSPQVSAAAAEVQVLRSLMQQIAEPLSSAKLLSDLLKSIAQSARDLCQAGTAGVSLIEATPEGEPIVRWVAIAGAYEPFEGRTEPATSSFCSDCLKQGTAQLYCHSECDFSGLRLCGAGAEGGSLIPLPVEVLAVPIKREQQTVGSLWVITHDEQKQCDCLRQQRSLREDLPTLTSLADAISIALSRVPANPIISQMQQETASRQQEELTDLKQMQAALQASEAKVQALVRNMPGVAYRYCGDTNTFSYISPGSRELFGLEPEALLQNSNAFWSLIHPDDCNTMTASISAAVRNSLPWQWEGRVITPSGQVKWIQGKFRPENTDDGMVWNGLLIDITDRRQAEDALRDREAWLRLIIESAEDYAIFTLDLEGQITSWNSGAQRLLGYEEAEILGQSGQIIYTPEDIALGEYETELHGAIAQGRKENERWHVRKDGSRFWGSGLVMPLSNKDTSVRGFLKILQDKTPQRQSQIEREQLLAREQAAREQAENANRIKDEFLAVLSHELRTPLNPILGWVMLLRQGKLDAVKTDRALETIERNAHLQAQMVEDLLDVSRILRGKFHLTPVPVHLPAIVQAALETVQLAAEAKSIQLETDLEPFEGKVLGDAVRLQQVMWNLLSNAVKFTSAGGRVTVRLERVEFSVLSSELSNSSQNSKLKAQNSYAQVTFIDTGKGITPEFLPYVFDYFRQADSTTTRQFGGLGLGLAIVRHLVELHGGSVQAESGGEGQGTTFTVRLPLRNESSDSKEQDRPSPLTPDSMPLAGVQVLLVDDDADARELITFALEQSGAIVTAVTSAIEALAVVTQMQPAILISDIGMPHIDGYTLIQKIRAMPQGEQIQVEAPLLPRAIALTAYAGDADQEQAIQAGFQKHMTKPIQPDKLIQTIVQQLREGFKP